MLLLDDLQVGLTFAANNTLKVAIITNIMIAFRAVMSLSRSERIQNHNLLTVIARDCRELLLSASDSSRHSRCNAKFIGNAGAITVIDQ